MSEPVTTPIEPATLPTEPEIPLTIEPEPQAQPGAWREGLSKGLQANPTFEKFVDLDGLAKGYADLEKHVGTEKVSVPQSHWKDEDYNQFYSALGRPETPEGYDLKDFTPPEEVPWDSGLLDRMIPRLHEAGLSQDQFRKVLDGYSEESAVQWQEVQDLNMEFRKEGVEALRKEWGRAYEERLDLANRAFHELAGDDHEALAHLQLEGGGKLGAHPSIVRIFARLGEEMTEAGLVDSHGGPRGFTPEQASAERARLNADESFQKAFMDRNHPEHALAVQRMHALTVAEVGEEEVR